MQKSKYIALLVLLLADLAYSAYQHYHMPIGGDMAEVVMPAPGRSYDKVLHDPFGINVLVNNEAYPNPNRFFAHWSVSAYFLNIPFLLQYFTDPVGSIYLSNAIIKIITQALIICLLAIYISNTYSLLNYRFILAALLITPFFQASGFCRTLGIIDQSVIYTFFYALPLGLLLLFFLPFFKGLFYGDGVKTSPLVIILLVLLIIVLSFNGPLVPGVVLIACPLVLLKLWAENYRALKPMGLSARKLVFSFRKIPAVVLFMFTGFCILSLYSLFIGMSNTLNEHGAISLLDRYARMPDGLFNLLTKKIAFPLLLSSIILNILLIRKYFNSVESRKIRNLAGWIGIFALIYILLLPFGGYRGYRENIVRYDTIMPVTLALLFIFGKTTYYLVENITGKFKPAYLLALAAVLIIFTIADSLNVSRYECERKAIETIAASSEKITLLDGNCPVMDWKTISDTSESVANAELFEYWKVTDEKKLYIHRVQPANSNTE